MFYDILWYFIVFSPPDDRGCTRRQEFATDDKSCIRRQHKQEHEVWLKINAAEGRPPTTRVASEDKSLQPTSRARRDASDDRTSKNMKCESAAPYDFKMKFNDFNKKSGDFNKKCLSCIKNVVIVIRNIVSLISNPVV